MFKIYQAKVWNCSYFNSSKKLQIFSFYNSENEIVKTNTHITNVNYYWIDFIEVYMHELQSYLRFKNFWKEFGVIFTIRFQSWHVCFSDDLFKWHIKRLAQLWQIICLVFTRLFFFLIEITFFYLLFNILLFFEN